MMRAPPETLPPSEEEIFALINQLLAADKRLDEILGGEVDSVMDRQGRTILLQRAQGELRREEHARQAAILNALPASIALLDGRGRVVSANTAWRDFAVANALVSPVYGIGTNYLAICDAAQGEDAPDARAVAAGIRAVLSGEVAEFSHEYSCNSPDMQRWYLVRITPLARHAASGVVTMHTDVTARRQAADALAALSYRTALKRQEALFDTLADKVPGVIWMLDATGTRLTYMNRAGMDLLGTTTHRDGQHDMPEVHPDDREEMDRELARAIATSTIFHSVRRLRAAKGGYRTMSCHASPVFLDNGSVDFWIGLDMDITDIKDVEAALRRSNAELARFSYAIAHDMRSPLAVISGFTQLLARELGGSAPARQLHLLSRIEAGVRQIDEVSEGLLALAGLARSPFQLEMTDLSRIARAAAALFADRDQGRKVEVTVQDGVFALCDRRMMQSVLTNLIGNAWKFTAKVERATISFTAKPAPSAGGRTSYHVTDNGAGFDMAYADKLYMPFQRLHTTDQFEGTGIGLATVRNIIERHGGAILAHGEPGVGATFSFTLGVEAADISGAS